MIGRERLLKGRGSRRVRGKKKLAVSGAGYSDRNIDVENDLHDI